MANVMMVAHATKIYSVINSKVIGWLAYCLVAYVLTACITHIKTEYILLQPGAWVDQTTWSF